MVGDHLLEERLNDLPPSPGVYLMKDAAGSVLYVGKAASLRSRVRSYFQSPEHMERKTRSLVAEIADFEVIRTATEAEAFLVEDTLIKHHQPRFNIRLRDDKRYPYLKITDEPFPRVMIVRRRQPDGARYFGPFTNVKAMRATLKLAQKLFPIRSCNLDLPLKAPRRPCLNAHIGRCLAPCAGLVSTADYREAVEGVSMLFEGRAGHLAKQLRQRMIASAEATRFEQAAALRDQVTSLRRALERQSVVLPDLADRDVIGVAVGDERACAQVFLVREGRLSGREAFHLLTPNDSSDAEVVAAFLAQYYANAGTIPKEVLLPSEPSEVSSLASWLTALRGSAVRLKTPKRGEKRRLVELASENARYGLKRERMDATLREEAIASLTELASAVSAATFPHRIEAFDVSNTQGKEATGSMVVFEEARPRRDAYRRFRIQTSGKPDDYAMMAEILRRRFRRGLAEIADPTASRGKFSEFPDLVLIDGGKGQLNVAVSTLRELEIEGIELLGLAKQHEEIYRPGESQPLKLPADSKALLLLRQIRDEAHRFAIGYHRRLRRRRGLSSQLDEIGGIGPKRRSTLIKAFGSLDRLARATVDEIAAIPGIPRRLAEAIAAHLKSPD